MQSAFRPLFAGDSSFSSRLSNLLSRPQENSDDLTCSVEAFSNTRQELLKVTGLQLDTEGIAPEVREIISCGDYVCLNIWQAINYNTILTPI